MVPCVFLFYRLVGPVLGKNLRYSLEHGMYVPNLVPFYRLSFMQVCAMLANLSIAGWRFVVI